MIKNTKLETLNKIYEEAEVVDRETFAEMRTNVFLVMGEHYEKRDNTFGFSNKVRTTRNNTDSRNKLRITKNHCHRVFRSYMSHILDGAPGVAIKPQRDTELQDQKSAELNQSVYSYAAQKYNFKKKFRQYCSDFVQIGETCVKIWWDHAAGDFAGYEPKIDEFGDPEVQVTVDEQTGEAMEDYVPDKTKPVFTGDFKFTRVFGPNLLRYACAESMEENPVWLLRDMVDVDELKQKYKDRPEVVDKITAAKDERYVVFNVTRSEYVKSKNQTELREYYIKPCAKYPEGWYVLCTKAVKLEEGPLPYGIWPLVWGSFDESPGNARGRSIIKVARPYQAEINRASSAQALQQITLGDDKVLYPYGSKLTQGSLLPGVRGIAYQGGRPPVVLQGRNGAQFEPYIQSQIQELDRAIMLSELYPEEGNQGVTDPMALLFRSASQKKKFKQYIENFEDFLISFTETFLSLAKHYYPDEMVIPAIGLGEQVNMDEFRSTQPQENQIVVEPQSDTLETKFGRQLSTQMVMQYVGKQLGEKQIGKLLKDLPYGNYGNSIEDLTMDEDNARNDMLSLERGIMPELNPEGDPHYLVQKLTSRMKKADFKYLHPQIQEMYVQYRTQNQQLIAEQEEQARIAREGKIPIEGAMVPCDLYVEDPANPDKLPKRWRAPTNALMWLKEQLEKQGDTDEKLEGLSQQALNEIHRQQQQMALMQQVEGRPPEQ